MLAGNKTITRWICAYLNSWLVNFPVLTENFIGLFLNSSNRMFCFFFSSPKLALSKETTMSMNLFFSVGIKKLTY